MSLSSLEELSSAAVENASARNQNSGKTQRLGRRRALASRRRANAHRDHHTTLQGEPKTDAPSECHENFEKSMDMEVLAKREKNCQRESPLLKRVRPPLPVLSNHHASNII